MRLAFVIEKLHPYGGRQRFLLRVIERLSATGHQSRIYCRSWQGISRDIADVRVISSRALRRHRRSALFQRGVQHDLAGDPVDGVVGFQPMPGLDACFVVDSCYLETAQREHSAWYRRGAAYRHFLTSERRVFAPPSRTHVYLQSEAQGQVFVQRYGTEAQRMTVLPPAVARDRYAGSDAADRRRQTRDAFALDERDIVLLAVGAPFADTGLARTLRSMAELRDTVPNAETRLFVVGDEPPGSHARLARKLGIADAVFFLGPRDDVADLMLAADVLVHPAPFEAGGLVLLEAMAAGLAVLTTATPVYASQVAAAGAGVILREPFSQRAMNEALGRFLRSDFRKECARAGLAFARQEDIYSGCERAVEHLVVQFGGGS